MRCLTLAEPLKSLRMHALCQSRSNAGRLFALPRVPPALGCKNHVPGGTGSYRPFRLSFLPLSSKMATRPNSMARSVRDSCMKLRKP